jgi:magnesium transporter
MSQSAIRTRLWRNGILEAENFPFERVSEFLAEPDCLVWADLLCPDHATVRTLAEELSLDEHAVEDALAHRERPKASRYATHMFMTAYVVKGHPGGPLEIGRVSAFIIKRGFVTVRLDDTLDVDAVLARWDDNADLIKYGPRTLIHGLLDEIVDGYFDTVQSLDDDVDRIEDILFDENAKAAHEVSRATFELRHALVDVRRAILPIREVINTILRRVTVDDQAPELVPYYEDLYDHALRVAEWTESLRDMVTSIFETNMSLSDTRMNVIMKKLTSWAAIIAVPTAITGYFGQNVPYPGYNERLGFWLSLVMIAGIAAALYVTFRRKDWL